MPGMHGDEFLRIVHAENPAVKLIMLSGHADERKMENLSNELGLFSYLSKPCRRNALVNIVRSALI